MDKKLGPAGIVVLIILVVICLIIISKIGFKTFWAFVLLLFFIIAIYM